MYSVDAGDAHLLLGYTDVFLMKCHICKKK